MYGGKFVSKSIGLACSGKEIYYFCFVFEGKYQVQAPRGAYIQKGNLMEGFLSYDFGGLIFEILQYYFYVSAHVINTYFAQKVFL